MNASMAARTWELIPETGKLGTTLDDRRELTIAWDGGDRSLYLSVMVPAPEVQGQQSPPRVYSAPLSLLGAMTIVPKQFHGHLAQLHQDARHEAEAEAMELISQVVELMPQPFPEPTKALDAFTRSSKAAGHVERLSLDLAAADAYTDLGTPV